MLTAETGREFRGIATRKCDVGRPANGRPENRNVPPVPREIIYLSPKKLPAVRCPLGKWLTFIYNARPGGVPAPGLTRDARLGRLKKRKRPGSDDPGPKSNDTANG